MVKIRLPYPDEILDSDLEPILDSESQCIPDQTIPLNELVMRYQQGLPLPRVNSYSDFGGDESEVDFDSCEVRLDTDITEATSELEYLRSKKASEMSRQSVSDEAKRKNETVVENSKEPKENVNVE